MKHPAASPARALFAVSVISLLSTASAADTLVSCDAVSCPLDPYNQAICTVGNTTSSAIGVASFKVPSSISSSTFTWTIGLQNTFTPSTNTSAPSNSSNIDRTYFLGTPPGTDLSKSAADGACAVFFEGAAEHAKFPPSGVGRNDETSSGTCADAITADCVAALVKQAQSLAAKLDGPADKCASLQKALASAPPAECASMAPQKSWGVVEVRDLSKLKPTKGSEDNCHPTTGKDYTLSLAASFRKPTPKDYQKHMAVATGVTPVMTVFWEGSKADVQLTCLKPVAGTAGMKADTDASPQEGAGMRMKVFSPVAVVVAMAVSFMSL